MFSLTSLAKNYRYLFLTEIVKTLEVTVYTLTINKLAIIIIYGKSEKFDILSLDEMKINEFHESLVCTWAIQLAAKGITCTSMIASDHHLDLAAILVLLFRQFCAHKRFKNML